MLVFWGSWILFFKKQQKKWKQKETRFGTLFGVAFFGKRFEEKSGRSKSKQKYAYLLPRTIFRRDARAIFYKEMNDKEFLRQPQGTDAIGGRSFAILMMENSRSSIRARQSSKMLIQYKHFNLLWALFIRSKICHCFSDSQTHGQIFCNKISIW